MLRAIEQALKGVAAEIAVVENKPDIIDIAAYAGYNIKQQRVYLGRVEKNTREIKNEIAVLNETLKAALELAEVLFVEEAAQLSTE